MNDITDAAAELGQGALTARAVEPSHGEAVAGSGDGHTHESACLNCGTALIGSHCHACGQAAHVHRTLGAFFHDLLHGVLHFEGKIWRTLPLLAWRPGDLTRRYIAGERARFVSPIALFLFAAFLTFALFSALGGVEIDPRVGPATQREFARVRSEAAAELAALDRQRAAAVAAGRPTATIDARLNAVRSRQRVLGKLDPGGGPVTLDKPGASGAEWVARINSVWTKARANPALLVYKLQSNAYKYSWLLIPISVPLIWLLFPFSRRFRLYDHTVFVTYSLSFMTLLAAITSLGAFWNIGVLVAAPMLYVPVHLYRQLRGAYSLTPRAALWRTAVLLVFAGVALVLFAAALLAMVAG